jgi:ribonuclease HI
MSKKIYIVLQGYQTGVFDNWDDCKKVVNGFPNAKYKSFKNENEIQLDSNKEYFKIYQSYNNINIDLKSKTETLNKTIDYKENSISVDGACSGNPGDGAFQCVDVLTGEQIFYYDGFKNTTNNIMEFLALVEALRYTLSLEEKDRRIIYSDSKTAISWVLNKKVKTSLNRNSQNLDSFLMIEKSLEWLKTCNTTYLVLPLIQKWNTKSWGEIPADFGNK